MPVSHSSALRIDSVTFARFRWCLEVEFFAHVPLLVLCLKVVFLEAKKLITARDIPTSDSKRLKSNWSPLSKENCSSRYASDMSYKSYLIS